jgi:MFS family permease
VSDKWGRVPAVLAFLVVDRPLRGLALGTFVGGGSGGLLPCFLGQGLLWLLVFLCLEPFVFVSGIGAVYPAVFLDPGSRGLIAAPISDRGRGKWYLPCAMTFLDCEAPICE